MKSQALKETSINVNAKPILKWAGGKQQMLNVLLPRALLAHQIPSQIEVFPEPVFSPFRIVLETLAGLERHGLDPEIRQDEMASIVQLTTSLDEIEDTV